MTSGPYICDLRHHLDAAGQLVRGGPAGCFAAFLAHVVESASVRPGEGYVATPVACMRRPNRMPCEGFITAGIVIARGGAIVEWSCPGCGMYGLTSGWEGSTHDLRDVAAVTRRRRRGPQVRLGLDRDAMRVARTPGLVSQELAAVLAAARSWPSGLSEIVAPLDVIEQLVTELADGDTALPAGVLRRRLRQAVAVIEAAIAERAAWIIPVAILDAPLLPPPVESSPVEAAVARLRSGEDALRRHARGLEPRSRALHASLAELQRSLILTTGAIWPDVALDAAHRMMAVLAEVGGQVQEEDEIAVLIEALAADIVALARDAEAPVLPELERIVALHHADREFLLTNVPRGLARAGLSRAEREYLAGRGLLVDEPMDSGRRH